MSTPDSVVLTNSDKDYLYKKLFNLFNFESLNIGLKIRTLKIAIFYIPYNIKIVDPKCAINFFNLITIDVEADLFSKSI